MKHGTWTEYSEKGTVLSFEIDLKATGVREGGAIKVEIIHEKGCEPKVLNPEVLN